MNSYWLDAISGERNLLPPRPLQRRWFKQMLQPRVTKAGTPQGEGSDALELVI